MVNKLFLISLTPDLKSGVNKTSEIILAVLTAFTELLQKFINRKVEDRWSLP